MQCYFCEFYRDFDELWIFRKKLEPGTPTDATGTPEHRKNHFDEVQAGFGTATHQEEHMCYLNVFAVLYCMAYDILKQTMYSMY